MSETTTTRSRQEWLDLAEKAVLAKGYRTVASALRSVDLDRMTYTRSIVDGLSGNPRTKTVRGLRRLGVYEIALRRV